MFFTPSISKSFVSFQVLFQRNNSTSVETCFVYMQLLSNSFSALATISSIIILEKSPTRFFCSENFSQSQSLLGLEDRYAVFVSIGFEKNLFLRDPARIAGD